MGDTDIELATRAILRAIRNKEVPPDSSGAYIWQFSDEEGPFWGGVFNAQRFAIHDPNGFADWVMGREDPKRPLNEPYPDQLKAVKLLPERLQKRIKKHEKQSENTETNAAEAATEISEP